MPTETAETLREAGRLDWWWASARQDTLCTYTLIRAHKGGCPVHGGDACLFVFARVADIECALKETAQT